MAAAAAIQWHANRISLDMQGYTRDSIARMNENQVHELLIQDGLFRSIGELVKTRFIQGDQPLAVAQKVSNAIKRIGYDNRYDPEITNLLAVTLATIAGVRFELFNIAGEIDEHINIVLHPQAGDELPVSEAARAADTTQQAATRSQAAINAAAARGAPLGGAALAGAQAAVDALANFPRTYRQQISVIRDTMLGVIKDTLTNLIANIRNLHLRIVLDPVIRSVQGRFSNDPQINEYLPRITMLITQILGHTFGQEGPFNIEDLRLIRILGRNETFISQVKNQSGVLKFTVSPERAIEIRADNIEDLKKYNSLTLQGINAYAYWKLMLYAPLAAWREVEWMKNLTNRSDKTWWENPAIRFDLFINAWILDTLSRIGQLKSEQSFKEKMALWKQLARLPAGMPNKIAISQELLDEISLFDAFFKIDYQSLFPRQIVPNVRLNPFNFLLDEGIRQEFVTQHFMEGIMIDCAKQALCAHVREAAIARQNGLRSYNGIAIGNPIIPDKRVDLRGLRYFLDFVDTKILSPVLERSSTPYFQLTIVMGTFMNYVSIYAFHDGVAPGNQNAWTAGLSPTLTGARAAARGAAHGRRGGPQYPSLLAYLHELRQRVENEQPLCETTPNVYLDIPVLDDALPDNPVGRGGGGPVGRGGGGPVGRGGGGPVGRGGGGGGPVGRGGGGPVGRGGGGGGPGGGSDNDNDNDNDNGSPTVGAGARAAAPPQAVAGAATRAATRAAAAPTAALTGARAGGGGGHSPVTPDLLFDEHGKLLLPFSQMFQEGVWSGGGGGGGGAYAAAVAAAVDPRASSPHVRFAPPPATGALGAARDPALAAVVLKSRSSSPAPLNASSDPGAESTGEPAAVASPQQRTGLRPAGIGGTAVPPPRAAAFAAAAPPRAVAAPPRAVAAAPPAAGLSPLSLPTPPLRASVWGGRARVRVECPSEDTLKRRLAEVRRIEANPKDFTPTNFNNAKTQYMITRQTFIREGGNSNDYPRYD